MYMKPKTMQHDACFRISMKCKIVYDTYAGQQSPTNKLGTKDFGLLSSNGNGQNGYFGGPVYSNGHVGTLPPFYGTFTEH